MHAINLWGNPERIETSTIQLSSAWLTARGQRQGKKKNAILQVIAQPTQLKSRKVGIHIVCLGFSKRNETQEYHKSQSRLNCNGCSTSKPPVNRSIGIFISHKQYKY